MSYRPDIDGLRTLAVMPVILFHAGASWLPGGFVGVDIFFVISGYLISSIIIREVAANQFSFLRFYERRVRRIIPALLVVLVTTVAIFHVIALPDQAQSAAESGIAALLSASNFYFFTKSGYFAPTADFMPLLHTWSLGVEEQFYLVFPIILVILWRLRLPIKWMIAGGTVALFALGLWLSINKPSVAYYLIPARAWELTVGAALAAGVFPTIRSPVLRQALPSIGVGLIVLATIFTRSDMIFPGWVALLPCLGAAMVIHDGGDSWIATRFLSSRLMVTIGLMSYSLYLWHWPVLAALRAIYADVHLSAQLAAVAVLATFGLAWLSWRYVETPFRNRHAIPNRRMFVLLGAGSIVTLGLAALSIKMEGFPSRLSAPARTALAAARDMDPLLVPCANVENRDNCRFGHADKPVTYAVIGDSFAAAIRPAIEASQIMGDDAGTLYWMGRCPLLEGARLLGDPPRARKCAAFKAAVWAGIEANVHLRKVVLAGRWPFYLTGWQPESGGSLKTWLVDDQTITPSPDENALVLARSLGRTLDRLAIRGIEVVIVGSPPEPGFDVPHTIALARHNGRAEPRGISRAVAEERSGKTDRLLARLAVGRDRASFVSVWKAFCDELQCEIEREGVALYSDHDHLSRAGALMVAAPAIAKQVLGRARTDVGRQN